MPNFCQKCGEKNRSGILFCTSCGARLRTKPIFKPVQESEEPILSPPPRQGSGCRMGCLIGCLIVILLIIIFLGAIFGIFYYYVFVREVKPGSYFDVDSSTQKTVKCDSFSCLDDNLKKCAPAKGQTDLGDFATAEIEILGASGSSCVVYAEIIEIKEVPSGLANTPEFIIEKLFENLSLECLIPKKEYEKGLERVGEYIGENMTKICKGPLFDLAEKFGVDLENINN